MVEGRSQNHLWVVIEVWGAVTLREVESLGEALPRDTSADECGRGHCAVEVEGNILVVDVVVEPGGAGPQIPVLGHSLTQAKLEGDQKSGVANHRDSAGGIHYYWCCGGEMRSWRKWRMWQQRSGQSSPCWQPTC